MSEIPLPTPARVADASDGRFRAVLDVARAVGSTLDLDELLELVMAKITEILGAERSTLFLLDAARGEIWSKVAQGAEKTEIRLPMGRGLAGFVAETGRPVNVKNAYEDPRFIADFDRVTGFQTHSLLAIPLRGKDGRITGVAQALNKRGGGGFTLDDERTLTSMSGLIGIALDNARLYSSLRAKNQELVSTQEKLRQKMGEMDLLFEIEREISAAPDLESTVAAILERALATVSAEAGAVLLFDESGSELHVKRDAGLPAEVRTLGSMVPDGVVAKALEAGLPLRETGEGAVQGSLLAMAGRPARSVLVAPLVLHARGESRIVGALELADRMPGEFTDDDEKLAALVAAQVARAVTIARARMESARAGRLAALGQALGGIVHDLRTPMTVVSGYAELMAMEDSPDERRKLAAEVLAQLDHVNAMTREVLAFVRGERQLLSQRVYIGPFWRDVAKLLSRELSEHETKLELDLGFDGVARFDEGKMRRLATNLARNAAQAMPKGGTFRIGCRAEGDALVLAFTDNGPGIPPQVAGRMFTAFNSRGKAGGTGLGLAIVKEVVDAHGGEVTFTTAPGAGTTFTVRLPGAVSDR